MVAASRPVALITGGARRIGAAIARGLHLAGFDLAVHYRGSAAEAEALAAELEAVRAGSVLLIQADLTRADSPARLVDATVSRYGGIDALVNNASTFFATEIGEIGPEQWDALFTVNAKAPFFLCQAAAPYLRARHGAIVNLIDIYAQRPQPHLLVYAASKAALQSLTQGLALSLAPDVRVNGIAPGAILWPEGVTDPDRESELIRCTPLQRIGRPGELAAAVAWLLLHATYTTGQVIAIDGGRMISEYAMSKPWT